MTKGSGGARVKLVPVDEATEQRLAGYPLILMSKPSVGEIIRIRVAGCVSAKTYRVLDVMHDVVWTEGEPNHFDVVVTALVTAT